MAFGTLKADTLTHSTAGSLDTNYVVNGSAKAWLDYKGTNTNAVQASLNISSVTDNGTGDYTIILSNSMSSAEYAIVDGTYRSENSNSPGITGFQTPTSSQYIHNHWNSGIGVSDMFRTYSQVNGDLA